MSDLNSAVLAWQKGQLTREMLVQTLSRVPEDQGEAISEVIRALCHKLSLSVSAPSGQPDAHDTDAWRAELMSSRARAWSNPDAAGMLVSPQVLILVNERQGVILREQAARCLPSSVCGSLLLLSQTIVMAQNAVNARELEQLQQQRIASTSTSLSAIEPVE